MTQLANFAYQSQISEKWAIQSDHAILSRKNILTTQNDSNFCITYLNKIELEHKKI